MKLIFEKSQDGRRGGSLPRHDLPKADVPDELRRSRPPRLPEVAEPELLRHFTELSTRNFGIDTGFYPLGSCTMKYNPRVNERLVMLPGFRDLHPYQEEDAAQGALELMWRLQQALIEVSGLHACSLQPAAGSQGELTGLMLMRAYFADRGEGARDTIVTADTAHGTNPASVTMAGYKLEKCGTDARGNLDLDDLRAKVNERTAGLMLTNPSTLGLFDERIEEVASIFHDAGALLYYDGANLNAVCGISRPGDMGFDIVHINLHKTFSQPHGGGGPGGGPIVVRDRLEPFLPVPAVVRDGDSFRLDYDRPKSIGKVRGYTGPFGVFVRSYAYIRSYGPRLREMSEVAVLNANYVLARLKDAYELPFDRLCMHEFVLSARRLKREHGITALDVAKRLMDYGFHPPTIYFPLIVPEALMIEPTETEAKETLDAFCDAMLAIADEAARAPELLKEAPHKRPVKRLDEVRAAKRPILKFGFDEHPTPSGEVPGGEAARPRSGPVEGVRGNREVPPTQTTPPPPQLEAQKGA
jgi:glycine dehydrogenase subunit 2